MNIPKYINDCPLVYDWCEYKGEVYFGALDVQRSIKSKRAMIDLSWCATMAQNNNVMKTVQWNNSKFNLKPNRFR